MADVPQWHWGEASDGLQLAVHTERAAYAVGEPIVLVFHLRNCGAEPLIVCANATSCDEPRLHPQLSACPLYALDGVNIARPGAAPERWAAVPSQMFMLVRWHRLLPAEELRQAARLDTHFWEREGAGPDGRGLSFQRGTHHLSADVESHAPDAGNLAAAAEFVKSGSDDVSAFLGRVMGLSLRDARQITEWGCRFWRGACTSPRSSFVVE